MEEESDVDSRTIFCGNLSLKVTEEILYELFLQGGPVERVKIPMTNGRQATYGFVTYKHVCSVDYALEIYKDTELYGSLLNLKRRQTKVPDNHDRETITSRNGNKQDNSALLQGGNNMIYMTNMYPNMMPQGCQLQQAYQNNMYYSSPAPHYDHHRRSPQKSRHQNISNRNNSQNYNLPHTPSGRYDQDNRSNRRYDDNKFRNNDRHDRKRHKR